MIAAALLLINAPSSGAQQADPANDKRAIDQQAAQQPQAATTTINAPVVKEKSDDGAAQKGKDDPSDSWVIRALKFFDRHNGAFNAFAAIAVAFFTWRLWRLSVKEIDALGQQSADVERSIAQAARAATAMEGVAASMGISATAAQESVIALKERTAQQMRAYLTVLVGNATFQERAKGYLFEGRPMMLNTGATPAHRVRFRAHATIMTLPIAEDFSFPLHGAEDGGATLNAHQHFVFGRSVDAFVPDQDVAAIKDAAGRALVVWGLITYDDIFGEPHKTEFGIVYRWMSDGSVFGHWTTNNNESD